MISIITAVYNQLPLNKLFFESLKKYTHHPFELIIIDNNSSDGTPEYFEHQGAKVIRNKANFSYPYCQNQGIKQSKYDYLFFLNNDLEVSKDWDKRAIEIMIEKNIDIATCVATDRLENLNATRKSLARWQWVRNPLLFLFGPKRTVLRLMLFMMYGNWEKFTEKRYHAFGKSLKEGISGSNVLMTRKSLSIIGEWDERIQGADFDIFLRAKKRSLDVGDIKPAQLLLGVYIHHYIRLTVKSKKPLFADNDNIIHPSLKWDRKEAEYLLKDTDLFF